MDNKEFKNKESEDNKRNQFVSIVLCGTLAISLFFPFMYSRYDDPIPVIGTMSQEQMEEMGFTTKPDADDSDIWESDDGGDNNAETSKTTVTVSDTENDTRITVVFPLDINSAGVNELVMVKGIGEVIAKRIVDYRGLNGYFYSLDELLNVEGIGEKKLESLKGYICIHYEELPETLPQPQVTTAEKAEVTAETTVPVYNSEIEEETSVKTVVTEELVMVTEEFITDYEEPFEAETENPYQKYWEEYLLNTSTEKITSEKYYPEFPLDLNTACAEDLIFIKGVGMSTANKIVEYARTEGFASVEDLLNISGIGEAKLDMIRPYVYVNSSVTTTSYKNTDSDTDTETISESVSSVESSQTTLPDSPPEIYRVNINTCGKDDLLQLPGIDESAADRILAFRSESGYFENIEELSFAIPDNILSGIWNYVYV